MSRDDALTGEIMLSEGKMMVSGNETVLSRAEIIIS